MKDLKISQDTVIHCETEQLVKEVCNLLHLLGCKLNGGDLGYYVYGDQACYHAFFGHIYSVKYCKEKSYPIISAVDFLKLHGYEITKKEVLASFDVEKAKAGAKVVYGMESKHPVRIVCYDVGRENYPLLVLVQRPEEEVSYAYSLKGEYFYACPTPNNDLFIVETVLKIKPPQIKEMTIEEIEKSLGYKVKIISSDQPG